MDNLRTDPLPDQVSADRELIPTHWYNILADLHGDIAYHTRPRPQQTAQAPRLSPQIPLSMYRQGVSKERFINIPAEVRQQYARWRPTPLRRAHALERLLGTPARIYFKYEGTSPSGSHKLNSALAQAYYYHRAGVRELSTGTGAGQWGTALAMACSVYGMGCTVYMVRCSYEQKPHRRLMMEINGARVIPSPSRSTEAGRAILDADPSNAGSLSIASSEAIQFARQMPDRRYSMGSGENHVLLHQTIIGEEALRQISLVDESPDFVIGAIGAGSNFGGLSFPFYRESLRTGKRTRLIAVEPDACPKLTRGRYAWDFNDVSGITPITKMYTLGHTFMPAAIHAGGLRYHGAAPIVSWMYHHHLIEAVAYPQSAVFEAALTFARAEQIIPAPESAHAIKAAIDKALEARARQARRVILFGLSGHGLMDLSAYEQYMTGKLVDGSATTEQIERSLGILDTLPQPE